MLFDRLEQTSMIVSSCSEMALVFAFEKSFYNSFQFDDFFANAFQEQVLLGFEY
jgi:hypothetical protein